LWDARHNVLLRSSFKTPLPPPPLDESGKEIGPGTVGKTAHQFGGIGEKGKKGKRREFKQQPKKTQKKKKNESDVNQVKKEQHVERGKGGRSPREGKR